MFFAREPLQKAKTFHEPKWSLEQRPPTAFLRLNALNIRNRFATAGAKNTAVQITFLQCIFCGRNA
jgi:hypothetical protein